MQKVENEEQADLLDDLIKKNQPITISKISINLINKTN